MRTEIARCVPIPWLGNAAQTKFAARTYFAALFFRKLIETWRTMCINASVFYCTFWETIEHNDNSNTIALCNRSFCYCFSFFSTRHIFSTKRWKKGTLAYRVKWEAKWTEQKSTQKTERQQNHANQSESIEHKIITCFIEKLIKSENRKDTSTHRSKRLR